MIEKSKGLFYTKCPVLMTKWVVYVTRCKALGFKVKGVYYSTRLSLNIQSNTADCVLSQTDVKIKFKEQEVCQNA